MAFNRRIIAIICACMMVVTCIFYIVSNAVPQWGSKEVGGVKSTIGLWRTCQSSGSVTICGEYLLTCSEATPETLPACNKMMASRAFITIACIISALSALCLFACGVISKDSDQVLIIIGKILLIVSFIAGLIGVAVGIAFVTNSPIEHGLAASAIIGIIAVIINAITAVVAIIMIR